MNRFVGIVVRLIVLVVIVALGVGAFVYSGVYNVAADEPHARPVFALMETLRERSVRVRSATIPLPDLARQQLVLKGAGEYAAMCTECHLRPGMQDSELRSGLYPKPPNLSQERVDARYAFWVIKHGLKMSAMPAWGVTHDDGAIWSIVAFLDKLPELTPAQYEDMVAKAPPEEDVNVGEEGGHPHHHGNGTADEGGHSHHHAGDEGAASTRASSGR